MQAFPPEVAAVYASLPLRKDSAQIRVLDLLPGKRESEIRISLRVIALDERPSYDALSYTWGQKTKDRSISINGGASLSVTDNLFDALSRLRSRIDKRTIWIDAICIDQSSDEERAQQVAMMGSIYKQATTVLVWLGEYPESSSTDRWVMTNPLKKFIPITSVAKISDRRLAEALNKTLEAANPKWHERAWIIQEFSHAAKLILHFGPVRMTYDPREFVDLALDVTRGFEGMPHLRAFQQRTSDLVALKKGISVREMQSLSEACLYTSFSACFDARDKVYSLLSLIDPREAQTIGVRYGSTLISEVFARGTHASILHQSNFEILELVSFYNEQPEHLPTWAVDFQRTRDSQQGRIHQQCRRNVIWSTEHEDDKPLVQINTSITELSINGTRFDLVAEVRNLPDISLSASGEQVRGFTEVFHSILGASLEHIKSNTGTLELQGNDLRLEESKTLLNCTENMQARNVIGSAFRIWDEVTGFSNTAGVTNTDPFWKLPHKEQTLLAGDTDVFEAGFFVEYANLVSSSAVLARTQQGFLALAPSALVVGDELFLVRGCKFPMILRKMGDVYAFRGLAFVHGIMDKELVEVWKQKRSSDVELRRLRIV